MAQAGPDWATGGAGFTQRVVGEYALLHQTSHTHTRTHTSRVTESPGEQVPWKATQMDVSWGEQVSHQKQTKRHNSMQQDSSHGDTRVVFSRHKMEENALEQSEKGESIYLLVQ